MPLKENRPRGGPENSDWVKNMKKNNQVAASSDRSDQPITNFTEARYQRFEEAELEISEMEAAVSQMIQELDLKRQLVLHNAFRMD